MGLTTRPNIRSNRGMTDEMLTLNLLAPPLKEGVEALWASPAAKLARAMTKRIEDASIREEEA